MYLHFIIQLFRIENITEDANSYIKKMVKILSQPFLPKNTNWSKENLFCKMKKKM